MRNTVEKRVISRIYGSGRGWAFSTKDFSDLGTRSSIDVALHRLLAKGRIRRLIRGLYDYPRHSVRLGRELNPDLDQVARALARKFGWRVQATGPAALNLLGLSTQVMGRLAYLSDGPSRTYRVGKQELIFEHTPLKEAGFRYRESSLLVQGLKTLGPERISAETIRKLREFLDERMRSKVLKDTRSVTGWVREALLKVCEGES